MLKPLPVAIVWSLFDNIDASIRTYTSIPLLLDNHLMYNSVNA